MALLSLEYVPDHFKTQEMYNEAVALSPYTLRIVPDWFVTQQLVKIWYNYYCDDDELIK